VELDSASLGIEFESEGLWGEDFATLAGLLMGGGEPVITVITYTYDPLSRLTAADYEDGRYFHYGYDAVGNRVSEETLAGEIEYVYDNANRLVSVDRQDYTWDDNGNLLSDGQYTYDYDEANRLSVVHGSPTTIFYSYNGAGDRVSRRVFNGVTNVITDYTNDIASGLTQVLADNDYTYLYGNGRIAQYSAASMEYFLTDALGSVRQLVDRDGQVTLAKSYEPFGENLENAGESESAFAYTGEAVESMTGYMYLRARYMDPAVGRFTQMDHSRLEANLYLYAKANPINRTDPTGLFSQELIAQGLGYSSIEEILYSWQETPISLKGDNYHFAWLALLLIAQEFDEVKLGIPVLDKIVPDISYTSGEILWLANCDQIMVGSNTLLEFTQQEVMKQRKPLIFWRDTSTMYYRLGGLSSLQTPIEYQFIEGGAWSDFPDFHTVDITIPLWGGISASAIVDRFGNFYLGGSKSIGAGGSFAYTEGYVCVEPFCDGSIGHSDYADEESIKQTIQGICILSGVGFGGSETLYFCPSNGAQMVVYGIGASAFVSAVGGAFAMEIPQLRDSGYGWYWMLEDRMGPYSISFYDVLNYAQLYGR